MHKYLAVLAIPLFLITACGDSDDPKPKAEVATQPAASTSPSQLPATPSDVAAQLKAAITAVTAVIELTEDNDVNGLIGRPGQYDAATFVADKRLACTAADQYHELGVDCGAKIERWGSEADAEARKLDIQRKLKDFGLGVEYDYVRGPLLLRVAGHLKPSQAADYEAVFMGGPAAVHESAANDSSNELRGAVQRYSDAFLTGKATESYAMLSKRCQDRNSLSTWTGIVTAAKAAYGKALPIRSMKVEVSGNLARVSYTYDVAAINQDSEPWVREDSQWREDDC